MTAFNFSYLLNTLSPDALTLRVRDSTYAFGGHTVQSMAITLVYVAATVFMHHDPGSAPLSFCDNHRDGLAVTPSEACLPLATVTGPGWPDCSG